MKQYTKLTRATTLALTLICLSPQTILSSQAVSVNIQASSSCVLGTSSALVTTSETETKKRAAAKHLVVFGLTEILLGHSRWKIGWKLFGWNLNILATISSEFQDQMRAKRIEVLNAVSTKEKVPFKAAGDDQGRPMGRIIFEQQAGTKTVEEAMKEINDTIERLAAQKDFFSSGAEKDLVTKLINTVDNPKVYINCMSPIDEGIELMELCSKNPDNELMILSNFGGGLREQLIELYPQVFKYFKKKPENILIAGDISKADRDQYFPKKPLYVIKPGGPEGKIFKYVEALTGYTAGQITFIDHTAIDVETAKNVCGWQALRVEKGDFGPVKQALIEAGIILSSNTTTKANTAPTAASTSAVAVNIARTMVSASNMSTAQIQEVPKVKVLAVQAS